LAQRREHTGADERHVEVPASDRQRNQGSLPRLSHGVSRRDWRGAHLPQPLSTSVPATAPAVEPLSTERPRHTRTAPPAGSPGPPARPPPAVAPRAPPGLSPPWAPMTKTPPRAGGPVPPLRGGPPPAPSNSAGPAPAPLAAAPAVLTCPVMSGNRARRDCLAA